MFLEKDLRNAGANCARKVVRASAFNENRKFESHDTSEQHAKHRGKAENIKSPIHLF